MTLNPNESTVDQWPQLEEEAHKAETHEPHDYQCTCGAYIHCDGTCEHKAVEVNRGAW